VTCRISNAANRYRQPCVSHARFSHMHLLMVRRACTALNPLASAHNGIAQVHSAGSSGQMATKPQSAFPDAIARRRVDRKANPGSSAVRVVKVASQDARVQRGSQR
jgi:hypothetical protein